MSAWESMRSGPKLLRRLMTFPNSLSSPPDRKLKMQGRLRNVADQCASSECWWAPTVSITASQRAPGVLLTLHLAHSPSSSQGHLPKSLCGFPWINISSAPFFFRVSSEDTWSLLSKLTFSIPYHALYSIPSYASRDTPYSFSSMLFWRFFLLSGKHFFLSPPDEPHLFIKTPWRFHDPLGQLVYFLPCGLFTVIYALPTSVPSNTVATSHTWLLCTRNVPSATSWNDILDLLR